MSTYYHTCPDCGCNLDPGEICDCKNESHPTAIEITMKAAFDKLYPTSDALIIGYDYSKNVDMACLIVARKNGDTLTVIKEFVGNEAIKTYESLTMGPCINYDPQMAEFLKKNFNIPEDRR